MVEVLQLVQLVYIIEQVWQEGSQFAQAPLLMTKGDGQIVTQVPLYRAAFDAQSTQVVIVVLQVAHYIEQLSHVRATEFAIVIKLGQFTMHS